MTARHRSEQAQTTLSRHTYARIRRLESTGRVCANALEDGYTSKGLADVGGHHNDAEQGSHDLPGLRLRRDAKYAMASAMRLD